MPLERYCICWFASSCKNSTYGNIIKNWKFQLKCKKKKLYRPDSTSPNPDCIVNIMKALVKIHVASSEFSCTGSSDSPVTFPAFEEFCVTFIFNLKNSTFSEVHFSRIISFVTQCNSLLRFKNNSRWYLQ